VQGFATRMAIASIGVRMKKKPGRTPGLVFAVANFRFQSDHDFN